MVNRQSAPPVDPLPQRRWTVDEYHRMIAAGILTARDRVDEICLDDSRSQV